MQQSPFFIYCSYQGCTMCTRRWVLCNPLRRSWKMCSPLSLKSPLIQHLIHSSMSSLSWLVMISCSEMCFPFTQLFYQKILSIHKFVLKNLCVCQHIKDIFIPETTSLFHRWWALTWWMMRASLKGVQPSTCRHLHNGAIRSIQLILIGRTMSMQTCIFLTRYSLLWLLYDPRVLLWMRLVNLSISTSLVLG